MTNHGQQEIKSLTGLRGLAAFYVVLYHFKVSYFFPRITETFFSHGYLAVGLFFILSGFVMACTYHSHFQHNISRDAFLSFIRRRIARIYPLYLVMTGIFIAFYHTFPHKIPEGTDFSSHTILSNLLLIQAWGIGQSFISTAWSISTEFAAYLLFPMIVAIVFHRDSLQSYGVALIGISAIFILYSLSIGSSYEQQDVRNLDIWQGTSIAPLIRCIAEFSIGLWAYRLYHSPSPAQKKHFAAIRKPWCTTVIATMIAVLLLVPHTDIIIVILYPFLLISLSANQSIISRFLEWAPIYFLGRISYSLYLCHLATFWVKPEITNLLTASSFPAPHFLTILIQIAMSLLFAAGLFYGIEQPGQKLFQKVNWNKIRWLDQMTN